MRLEMKKIFSIYILLLLCYQLNYAQYLFTPQAHWRWSTITYLNLSSVVNAGLDAGISSASGTWNSDCGVSIVYDANSQNLIGSGDLGGPNDQNCDTYMVSKEALDANSINIASASMVINTNSNIFWSTDVTQTTLTEGYTDVWSLALHEFGHWLGLADNGYTSSIMNAGNIVLAAERRPYTPDRTPSSDDITNVENLYSGVPTPVDGELVITSGSTAITQTSTQTYFTTFYSGSNNNYLVSEAFSILAEYQGGEYVAATGADIISLDAPLPYGYYWLRDANGNVLARVKDVGTDNQGYIYTAYYKIVITGVPPNTTTGTLAHNEAWGGTNNITGNVIVPSNCTLTILPNAMIHLPSNVSLTVNGILNANGTSLQPITFTSTSGTSPGSWGSIILSGSGANGSSLNYINMQYGTEIEALNTSNITIQYSTIQNCKYGIYASTATGSILNNTIKNLTSWAILLNASAMDCKYNVIYKTPGSANYGQGYGLEYENGSSGIVYQNDIAGMAQGINDFSGSWISSNGPYDNNKNNRITNCNEGLFLYQQSTAILGTTPNTGGQWNSIYGNVYNVYLVGNSVEVYAYGNWWGSYPPNTSLFAGTIFYDYSPLNYDPWRGIPLHLNNIPSTPVIADNKSIDVASTSQSESGQVLPFNSTSSEFSIEPLLDGIALLNQNRYNDAKNFFLSYLSKHPDNQSAYVALYNCYNKETAPDITKYFSSLPPQAAKDHKFLLSNLYLKQGKVDLAKGVNNSVIHDNPNTSLSERGKLNKMYIALDIDNNIDSASAIFTDVLNSPNLLSQTDLSQAQERIETYAATRGKAKPNFKMQGGTNNSIPTTISLNNFPNPFNPTTNISYQLIENSRVSIKVYDILGRQVATLVDGNKAAGQYITVFDGSRYASGIYFVRMMVQGSSAQQIVKTLKIQMLK